MDKIKKGTLLIIEDSDLNISELTRILGPEYDIEAKSNGYEGMKAARKFLPDIIILDIVMPKVDGFDTIISLKRDETTREIPVIFITGLTGNKDEIKGLSLGGADYITKPFSDEIVKLRVGNQMRILNYIRTIKLMSMQDQLTGIPNRRSFDERINLEWERAQKEEEAISILVIDVDDFKNINDKYGHLQGDVVLQTIAKVITQTLKLSNGFVARWGGEEFIALIPDMDSIGAVEVAEQTRKNIENTTIPLTYGKVAKVSVSVGINTQVPTANYSVDKFIYYADNALYTAKASGKNRVCRYE